MVANKVSADLLKLFSKNQFGKPAEQNELKLKFSFKAEKQTQAALLAGVNVKSIFPVLFLNCISYYWSAELGASPTSSSPS